MQRLPDTLDDICYISYQILLDKKDNICMYGMLDVKIGLLKFHDCQILLKQNNMRWRCVCMYVC